MLQQVVLLERRQWIQPQQRITNNVRVSAGMVRIHVMLNHMLHITIAKYARKLTNLN